MYKVWKKSFEKCPISCGNEGKLITVAAILKNIRQTKPIFELIRDIHDRKACIKFARNPLRNAQAIVVTRENELLWRPFWKIFVGQNPAWNTSQIFIRGMHVSNLEVIY